MQLVPPLLDLRDPCFACGHTWTWHTADMGGCQHEILDPAINGWMRCACEGWKH